ncbi:hypothetical protein [Streptomyces sp. NPDC059753]|uniref:DUF7169 domain-containing protein n=1 Tax=Streptomyces sp. NPDC059753 TaxID=3346933 RepID=UPI00364CDCBF
MTYSSEHVADGQQLTALAHALQRDLDELRHFLSIYDDAVTMPGLRPDVDADGTGRQATHGPSRPTERTALDSSRAELQAELKNGTVWLPRAIAIVRGVVASMDRALSTWEGESIDAAGGKNLILITGPQETHDDVGQLAEMAGLLGAHTATCPDLQWADVTDVYVLSGWESCPLATADMGIAKQLGVPVHHLAP